MKTKKQFISIILLASGIFGAALSGDMQAKSRDKHEKNFFFDALGDFVYNGEAELAGIQKLIDNVINKECPAFVVHVGDQQNDPRGLSTIGSLSIALTENQFRPKRDFWWQIKAPFIITPGDNDWADTIVNPGGPTPGNPPFPPNPDPIATLDAFRQVWYKEGTNAKFPFKVISQPDEFPEFSAYIENKRWCYNDIIFVTVHTIGLSDNNGLNPGQSIFPEARAAIINETTGATGRIEANQAWLNKAFDIAEKKCARGLVIITQADPDFSGNTTGFQPMLRLIRDRSVANIKNNLQVLFIRGDSHVFGINKPLPLFGAYPPFTGVTDNIAQTFVPNFTAVSIPGTSGGGARQGAGPGRVKIEVDFETPGLFKFYSSLTSK